jgi:hypothetical protein
MRFMHYVSTLLLFTTEIMKEFENINIIINAKNSIHLISLKNMHINLINDSILKAIQLKFKKL